jgi:hypothetical protein
VRYNKNIPLATAKGLAWGSAIVRPHASYYGRKQMKFNFIDLTGQVFGKWTVLKYTKTGKNAFWLCKCECGVEAEVDGHNLRIGGSLSCGNCAQNVKLSDEYACLRRLYNVYKNNAKKFGRIFELSLEQFKELTKSNCVYCGLPPLQVCTRSDRVVKPEPYIYNGLDRANNDEGYTLKNAVPCCKMCNRAKMDYSLEEFNAWVDRLIKVRINRESPANSGGESINNVTVPENTVQKS